MRYAYNFLDPKLSPKLRSSAAATDDYEVGNLISYNPHVKSRGFLAYSAIKPPVDIDLELICPINLHYITLNTTLGAQKCTGIEILARGSTTEFSTIALAFFNTEGVMFCNGRLYSKNNRPTNCQDYHLCFFRSNLFRIFTNVSFIKIRILRTENSVPCLAAMEVWGKASKTCSQVTVDTINRLMNKSPVANTSNDSSPCVSSVKLPKIFQIPDDFKDALTYEIMAIPMTLPSGNTVDQSTLEKYTANEASYGRHGSDPFTGQAFTATRKPAINTALKSRIDMFLLEHANKTETFNITRTVGSACSLNRKSDLQIEDEIKKRTRDSASTSVCEKKSKLESHTVNKLSNGDADLDELIKRTVSDSNFVRYTTDETVSECDKAFCVLCKTKTNLYTLPCKHFYCRHCLLEIYSELKCKICAVKFLKSDPARHHV